MLLSTYRIVFHICRYSTKILEISCIYAHSSFLWFPILYLSGILDIGVTVRPNLNLSYTSMGMDKRILYLLLYAVFTVSKRIKNQNEL